MNDQPEIGSGFIDSGGKNGEIDKPEVQGKQIPYFIYYINTNVGVINIDTQIPLILLKIILKTEEIKTYFMFKAGAPLPRYIKLELGMGREVCI